MAKVVRLFIASPANVFSTVLSLLTLSSISNHLAVIREGGFVTPGCCKGSRRRGGRVEAHSTARPLVPISSSLTHQVYLLQFWAKRLMGVSVLCYMPGRVFSFVRSSHFQLELHRFNAGSASHKIQTTFCILAKSQCPVEMFGVLKMLRNEYGVVRWQIRIFNLNE